MKMDDVTNWMKHAAKDIDYALRNFEGDDILKALGVEKRRSTFSKIAPTIAFFGVGIALGAGAVWFLAPKSAHKAIANKAKNAVSEVAEKAEKTVKTAAEKANGLRAHA